VREISKVIFVSGKTDVGDMTSGERVCNVSVLLSMKDRGQYIPAAIVNLLKNERRTDDGCGCW
jgi:hypothetical protein